MRPRKCNVCNVPKPLSEFAADKQGTDGKSARCKECNKRASREYYKRNRDRCLQACKTYRTSNKANIKRRQSARYSADRNKYLKRYIEYYRKNRDKAREYATKNAEKISETRRRYRSSHSSSISAKRRSKRREPVEIAKAKRYRKEYYSRPEVKHNCKEHINKRYHTDINFRIAHNMRTRMRKALLDKVKSRKTMEYLGCTVPEYRRYIESKFQPTMNWNNYGKWHIDHIKPCAKFDLTQEAQIMECFRFTNTQPLWAIDNARKGSHSQATS